MKGVVFRRGHLSKASWDNHWGEVDSECCQARQAQSFPVSRLVAVAIRLRTGQKVFLWSSSTTSDCDIWKGDERETAGLREMRSHDPTPKAKPDKRGAYVSHHREFEAAIQSHRASMHRPRLEISGLIWVAPPGHMPGQAYNAPTPAGVFSPSSLSDTSTHPLQ